MDKNEFTAMYEQWFALHPFKKRDWPELGKVHYQSFSRESPAAFQEALGMLTEEIDNFPSPKQIRAKLNQLSNNKTEGGEGKTNTTSENEKIATRLLEHKMGIEYNGKKVKKPANVPSWINQLVDKAINELHPKYPMKTMLGTVGYLVVQTEGKR